jgi:hypothetical protein
MSWHRHFEHSRGDVWICEALRSSKVAFVEGVAQHEDGQTSAEIYDVCSHCGIPCPRRDRNSHMREVHRASRCRELYFRHEDLRQHLINSHAATPNPFMSRLVDHAHRKAPNQILPSSELVQRVHSYMMSSREDLENDIRSENSLIESLDRGANDYGQTLAASEEYKLYLELALVAMSSGRPLAGLNGASDERRDQILEPVSQRDLPASDDTLSSSQKSREPSNEATWGSREQDWSSSLSASSEGHAPATSPYNSFVMTESTDTISDNLLADMNIPFRVSQPSEQWTTPALQSTTWGNLQHPMFPVQQQPDLASSIPIPSAQGAVPPASPPPTQISDIASGQDSYDGREAQSSAHPWAPLLPGGSVPQSGCIDPRVITHTGSWNEQDHHNHRRGHQDTVCTASSSCSYKIRYGFH